MELSDEVVIALIDALKNLAIAERDRADAAKELNRIMDNQHATAKEALPIALRQVDLQEKAFELSSATTLKQMTMAEEQHELQKIMFEKQYGIRLKKDKGEPLKQSATGSINVTPPIDVSIP